MSISKNLKLPDLTVNLHTDVQALFALSAEKDTTTSISNPTVADLAAGKVKQEFTKLLQLHGSAQDQARKSLIESLQVYNRAVDAHQKSQIAALESPFISAPDLERQYYVIQTAMQRDMLVNARKHAEELAKYASNLWGTSSQNERELHDHFIEVAEKNSDAILQFDSGNADAAFDLQHRALWNNDAHIAWLERDMRRSEQLKKVAEIGITAAAATVATLATSGAAMAYFGPEGLATLSGGAQLGLLTANSAAFVASHRALEQKVLNIPFLRKDGIAANMIDFAADVVRTGGLMGSIKVAAELAPILLPIVEHERALIAARNFGMEYGAMNVHGIATGMDPRLLSDVHYHADQLAFLLGLKAANGLVGGLVSTIKHVTELSPEQEAREREAFVNSSMQRNQFVEEAARAMRDPVLFKKWATHSERGFGSFDIFYLMFTGGAAAFFIRLAIEIFVISGSKDRKSEMNYEKVPVEKAMRKNDQLMAMQRLLALNTPEATNELVEFLLSGQYYYSVAKMVLRTLIERGVLDDRTLYDIYLQKNVITDATNGSAEIGHIAWTEYYRRREMRLPPLQRDMRKNDQLMAVQRLLALNTPEATNELVNFLLSGRYYYSVAKMALRTLIERGVLDDRTLYDIYLQKNVITDATNGSAAIGHIAWTEYIRITRRE